MDLSVRNSQTHTAVPGAPVNGSGAGAPRSSRNKIFESSKLVRTLYIILLAGIAILLVSIAFSFVYGNHPETNYINTNDYQAVDISVGGSTTGDQIYFGSIKTITSSYLVLNNVYYIPTSSTSSANVTLEPLVCQIDSPYNQMIINRSSVNWWENLQSTSKVSTSIANYVKSNPKGPTCPTAAPATTTPTTPKK